MPSGHAANIVVFSATLGLLLAALTGEPRWTHRLLVVGAVSAGVCVACMTYLNYHWVTDAAAGLLLGAALRAVVAPLFAMALRHQAEPR
jgi:phosphate/sulfate permease